MCLSKSKKFTVDFIVDIYISVHTLIIFVIRGDGGEIA